MNCNCQENLLVELGFENFEQACLKHSLSPTCQVSDLTILNQRKQTTFLPS